jgi:hypothetical protein
MTAKNRQKYAQIVIALPLSFVAVVSLVPALWARAAATLPAAQSASGQTAIAKSIGVIKAINGNALTLAPASGPEISANVQPNARILRLAPGEKDLKNASPIQLQDLQVGDTVRVRGYASADSKSIATLEVIVITKSALAAVSDQIRQDWQKRGLGGVVSAVDPATGTVTIATGFSGKKTVAIHTSKNTIVRRYSPDSIKFEDAKPSSLAEIQPGDQLRARGDRSPDGAEFTAEEVVAGRFRNIAGTVISVDASTGTLNVQDLLSKKAVEVKVTPDSQLHRLPAEAARFLAMSLKGNPPPGAPGAGNSSSPNASSAGGQGAPAGSATGPGMGGGSRAGGADFQRMLNRMPAVSLSDLHKGDAVMLVTTEGSSSSPSTAITLLSGVEPILEAAPNASQAMMLTPWTLGGAPSGGDAGNP